MQMMKRYLNFFGPTFIVAILMAAGCASLGLEPAQSFDQKLAYAYGTHTAVLKAADAALTAGSINVEDARKALNLADEARTYLDAAKLVYAAGDTGAANNKLALATAILTQLQTYLNTRRS